MIRLSGHRSTGWGSERGPGGLSPRQGAIAIYIGYTFYARRIDRLVIEADARKATPATLYMDGVDFVPTSRNVLYGYHFKSIAAAGLIVGAITAAGIWGGCPASFG